MSNDRIEAAARALRNVHIPGTPGLDGLLQDYGDINDVLEMLARAALAAADACGWQTIESAPKDGTEVIGLDAREGIRCIIRWGKHNHVPLNGWIRQVELYGEEVDGFDATHWRPLPPPPGATQPEVYRPGDYSMAETRGPNGEPLDELMRQEQPGESLATCLGCLGGSVHHTCGREPDADKQHPDPLDEAAAILGDNFRVVYSTEVSAESLAQRDLRREQARRFCELIVAAAVERMRAELFTNETAPE